MQMAQSHKPFNKVDYYPLGNGFIDVYLHKNETQETDEEGNVYFKAEEVCFQISDTVTKEEVEEDFELYWDNEGERVVNEPTTDERIEMLETMLSVLLGVNNDD